MGKNTANFALDMDKHSPFFPVWTNIIGFWSIWTKKNCMFCWTWSVLLNIGGFAQLGRFYWTCTTQASLILLNSVSFAEHDKNAIISLGSCIFVLPLPVLFWFASACAFLPFLPLPFRFCLSLYALDFDFALHHSISCVCFALYLFSSVLFSFAFLCDM